MSFQSSGQDFSLEEENVKRDDKPSSSHLSARSGTFQTKKNPATSSCGREKCTVTASGSLIRTPSAGSSWPEHKTRITILADQMSCRICIQLCARRLHRKSGIPETR